jgi:hypothetical protein
MNTEQREEIERAIRDILEQEEDGNTWVELPTDVLLPLAQFARQQLSLRVDGEKLISEILAEGEPYGDAGWIGRRGAREARERLEALVLECLTTEEKP